MPAVTDVIDEYTDLVSKLVCGIIDAPLRNYIHPFTRYAGVENGARMFTHCALGVKEDHNGFHVTIACERGVLYDLSISRDKNSYSHYNKGKFTNRELHRYLTDFVDFVKYLADRVIIRRFTQPIHDTEPRKLDINGYEFLAKRYSLMLMARNVVAKRDEVVGNNPSHGHLLWMIAEVITNSTHSETKRHRWIGFVQGCLIKDGLMTVEEEREATRALLNGD